MDETTLLKLDLKRTQEALRQVERLLEQKLRALYQEAHTLEITYQRLLNAHRELKETQAELIQSAKMASIGQLAAGIAHEINNPVGYIVSNLNTIMDYFQDLERLLQAAMGASLGSEGNGNPGAGRSDAAPALREKLAQLRAEIDADYLLQDFRKAVQDCQVGAHQIREIVRNLKDFSHTDEGEMVLADINKGIESALQICWNELKYKATVRRDYGEIPKVLCYPHRLNQVFMNLLVNAAQAIEERGEVHVSTSSADGEVLVRIRDTGKGIPPEHMARLFEPFFTTKPVGKGTGLGLHMAYKITRAHGGRIEVTSQTGKGSEFTVHLPIQGPLGRAS